MTKSKNWFHVSLASLLSTLPIGESIETSLHERTIRNATNHQCRAHNRLFRVRLIAHNPQTLLITRVQ
jgi:hypothetical protein